MAWIGQILAPMLPKLLEFIFKGIGNLGSWLWKKYKKRSDVSKSKDRIDSELDRLKKALEVAFDGTPITDEEKEEINRAFSDLVRDY